MGTIEYVLQREVPDHRDHPYRAPDHVIRSLPDHMDLRLDLRLDLWPVWDQVAHNSCTANVLAAAMQLLLMKEKRKEAFEPSRLFIFYNEREIEGNQTWDAPVYMRDGIQSVSKTGVCPEPLWPQASSITEKPSDEAYLAAKEHRAVAYRKVPHDLPHMRGCLATGYPFTIGIQVYLSYLSAMATGDIPPPKPATEMHRGGHALLVVGYDESKQSFIVRNSEGDHWGDGGYGTLPYEYATDDKLADSLWTLRYAT